ncbi:MAG: anthranilate synthase component I [Deltaproteobacteria bacterium]|nr:anthranilate synthase component I [Deltaproteobacteria bacterium]
MIKPNLSEFKEMAGQAGLIPVCREVIADLDTPLTVFAKVAAGQRYAFLLESLQGGEKWGRYSFIGIEPLAVLSSRGDKISIRRGEETQEISGDPITALKDLLASFGPCDTSYLPRFFGGAVGYMGYDMVRFMEELPSENPPLADADSALMVPRIVLIYDNVRQTITVVNCVPIGAAADLAAMYREALVDIERIVELLRQPLPETMAGRQPKTAAHDFSANMSEQEFKNMVTRAQDYILAGDVIQVVLSQKFHAKTTLKPLTLYRALRHINPSPYLFYVQLDGVIQIGSSPEILVRLEDGDVELRPIAGTRKRGGDEAADLALERELLADPKERAEHLMLVDLGRNDLGRVCRYGTVETRDLMVVERYSHVMHIVSGLHGELRPGLDQFDVLKACFPAGTVSGAPKIRAMEIIEELEPERRGSYAGAVGYFGFSGNMDICITIRTFVMRGDDLWLQAGAGIVADSDPQTEFEETINKAMGLRKAVELAEKGLSA